MWDRDFSHVSVKVLLQLFFLILCSSVAAVGESKINFRKIEKMKFYVSFEKGTISSPVVYLIQLVRQVQIL